jgi:hypothetical protein
MLKLGSQLFGGCRPLQGTHDINHSVFFFKLAECRSVYRDATVAGAAGARDSADLAELILRKWKGLLEALHPRAAVA